MTRLSLSSILEVLIKQATTMTRRQLALLQTARSTGICLDWYQDSWKDLPGFARNRDAIRNKLAELEDIAGNAAADRGNLAGQRQNAIQALAEEAWIVAGQVQAWAVAHGTEESRDAMVTTRDELVWLQMGLPERALEIHQRARECMRSGTGADFGMSDSRLNSLSERIQAVKILRVPGNRCEANAKSESPAALDEGLNQVMDLLCEVIDPLMRRFRLEDPVFFEAYQVARRVVDPETGTLVSSDMELSSLDEPVGEFPVEVDGAGDRGQGPRSAVEPGDSRTRKGAAALSS